MYVNDFFFQIMNYVKAIKNWCFWLFLNYVQTFVNYKNTDCLRFESNKSSFSKNKLSSRLQLLTVCGTS